MWWTYQTDSEQYLVKRKDLVAGDGEVTFVVPNSQFRFMDTVHHEETQLSYILECKRRNNSILASREIILTV